jgi:hypothetical protein
MEMSRAREFMLWKKPKYACTYASEKSRICSHDIGNMH